MLISIGDYDLCDGTLDGGMAASGLRLRFTRTIEVVQELGEVNPVTFDRGTRTIDLSFTVQRVHESIRASELFIGNHENAVPQSGPVKLTTGQGHTAFIANGFLVEIQLVSEIGATTSHSYRITGGVFYANPGVPGRPETLSQVIKTGIAIGLWNTDPPTTLTEVIDTGTALGLWPSVAVPVTPTTLNEVIAAGVALHLWL